MGRILKYFLSYAVIQIGCYVAVQAVWQAVVGSDALTAERLIATSSISNIIAIAIFTLTKWTPLSLEFFHKRPWAIIYWCLLISLGMLIPSGYLENLIPESMRTDIAANEMKMIMGNNWGYLAVGILAPLAEEIVFRGGIQKESVKFFGSKFAGNAGHWIGITFTAMLFAAFHGNLAQMPHAFLVGLLMGWLCYRSGSIIPGVVVHWVNNSVAFAIYKAYPQSYDMDMIDFFGGSAVRLGMAIALSLLLFVPALWQLHLKMKKMY